MTSLPLPALAAQAQQPPAAEQAPKSKPRVLKHYSGISGHSSARSWGAEPEQKPSLPKKPKSTKQRDRSINQLRSNQAVDDPKRNPVAAGLEEALRKEEPRPGLLSRLAGPAAVAIGTFLGLPQPAQPAAPPAVAPATPQAKLVPIRDQMPAALREKIDFWRQKTQEFFAGQKMEEPVDDNELQVPVQAHRSYKSDPDHPDDRYLGVERFWVYDLGVLLDYFVERGQMEEADWLADRLVEIAKAMEKQGKKGGWRFSHGPTHTDARAMSGGTAWVFHGLSNLVLRTQDRDLLDWVYGKFEEVGFAQQVMDPQDPRHGLFRAGFGAGSTYNKELSEVQREEITTEHVWDYINVLRVLYRALKAVDPHDPRLKEINRRHDLAMRKSWEMRLTPEKIRAQMERLRKEGVLDEKLEQLHRDALAEIEKLPGKMRWPTGMSVEMDEDGRVKVWYLALSWAGDNESWSPHAAYNPAMGLNELKNIVARFLVRLRVKDFDFVPTEDIHGTPIDPEETLTGSIFFTKNFSDPHVSASDDFERMIEPEQTWGEIFRFFQHSVHAGSPQEREWARQWAVFLTQQMIRLDEIYGEKAPPYSTKMVAVEQYGAVEGIFTTMAGLAAATHQGIVLEDFQDGIPSTTYLNALPDPDMLVDGKPPVWSTTEAPKPIRPVVPEPVKTAPQAKPAAEEAMQPEELPVPPPPAETEEPAPAKAKPAVPAKPAAEATLRLPANAVTRNTVTLSGLDGWVDKVAVIWILQDQYYLQDTQPINEDGRVGLTTPYDRNGWVEAARRGKDRKPGILVAVFENREEAENARTTMMSAIIGGKPVAVLAVEKVQEDGSATVRPLQGVLPSAKPEAKPAAEEMGVPESPVPPPPAEEEGRPAPAQSTLAKPAIQAEIVEFSEEAVSLKVTGAPKDARFVLFVRVGREWYVEPYADERAASRMDPDTGTVTVKTVIRDGRGQIVPGKSSIVVFSSQEAFDKFMDGYRGYRLTMDKKTISPAPAAVIHLKSGPQGGKPRADVSGVWIVPKLMPESPVLAAFFADRRNPFPFLLLAGLEEAEGQGWTRRDFLRWTGSSSLAAVAAAAGLPLLGAETSRRAVQGALAPLAGRFPNLDIGLVVWPPEQILGRPDFFRKAVRAGVTTVWISGYGFRNMGGFIRTSPEEQQQRILDMANQAGLQTLGFIDGNYDWVQQKAFVAEHYDSLAQTLLGLNAGRLRYRFGTDVEPYTHPQETGWNGNLAAYTTLLEGTILPRIQSFAKQAREKTGRDLVTGSWLTRFEPYWYRNGKRTEEGYELSGLKDIPYTVLAGMTYANASGELLGLSTDIRVRAQGAANVGYQMGVETLPGNEVGGDHLTFAGREGEIAGTALEVLEALPQDDRRLLNGLFIHTRNPQEAEKVLDQWLAARPAMPEPPAEPVAPVSGREVEVVQGSVRWTDTQLTLRFRNAPRGAHAIFLLKIRGDRYYPQPREGATAEVGTNGLVTGTTVFSPPNRPGWLGAESAVILIFGSRADATRFHATIPQEIGLGRVKAREDMEPQPLQVIRATKDGTIDLGATLNWSLVSPLAGPISGPDLRISMQYFTGMQLAALNPSMVHAAAGLEEANRFPREIMQSIIQRMAGKNLRENGVELTHPNLGNWNLPTWAREGFRVTEESRAFRFLVTVKEANRMVGGDITVYHAVYNPKQGGWTIEIRALGAQGDTAPYWTYEFTNSPWVYKAHPGEIFAGSGDPESYSVRWAENPFVDLTLDENDHLVAVVTDEGFRQVQAAPIASEIMRDGLLVSRSDALRRGLIDVSTGLEEPPASELTVVVSGISIPPAGLLLNWYSTVATTGELVPEPLQAILHPSQDRLVVPLAEISPGTVVHVQERFDALGRSWRPVISLGVMDALAAADSRGEIQLKRFRLGPSVSEPVAGRENVYVVDLDPALGGEQRQLGQAGIVINLHGSAGPWSPEELGALINAAREADNQVLRAPRLYRSTDPELRNRVFALDTQL